MPSIDFRKVKEMTTLSDALCLINYPDGVTGRGRCKRRCPLFDHADGKCCSFDLRKCLWYCHRCKVGGGPLELVMFKLGLSPYQAAVKLCEGTHQPIPYITRHRTPTGTSWSETHFRVVPLEEDQVD